MARKLAVSVHVHDDGETTVYQAGDVPSPKHAKLITNDSVWDVEAGNSKVTTTESPSED